MKRVLSIILAITLIFSLAGCKSNETEVIDQLNTNPENMVSNDNVITISQLKAKYGVADRTEIKPFYNVGQETRFTFHFNSLVKPYKAITVHTDPKCEVDSTVYQLNDGYVTNDGVDVVVNPGKPVLNSSDRESGELGDNKWGNAPVYYLCIRYDLESTEVKELDEPIIVPFTIYSEVSIPTLTGSISNDGSFKLEWLPVDGAESYNIYRANRVRSESEAVNFTRAECGYVGDHLEKIKTVDKNTLSFNDFGLDGTANTVEISGYTSIQNSIGLDTYYITAVDSNGNESLFSMAVEGWKYENQLPRTFDSYNSFVRNEDFKIITLPETVEVTMADNSTHNFPIEYTKISEEYGDGNYEYHIIGTKLSGEVTYTTEDGTYPDKIEAKGLVDTAIYEVKNSQNIIPENTVNTITDERYENTSFNLNEYTPKDEAYRITYSQEVTLGRADIENARMILDGVYPEGKGPWSMFDYGAVEVIYPSISNNTIVPEEPNITEAPIEEPNITETPIDNSTVIEEPEGTEVEEIEEPGVVETEGPEGTEPEGTEVVEPENPVNTPENPVDTPENPVNTQEVPVEIEIPEEITSDNLVENQLISTETQVKEANTEEIPVVDYTIFADSAEEEWVALNMLNGNTEFSVLAFPKLQDTRYLADVVDKVYYQNPYCLGYNDCGYDYNNCAVYMEYPMDSATMQKQQSEIKQESERIISETITSGMSDQDKILALWEYLEDNTSYDYETLEKAEGNGFSFEGLDRSAFNAYGIICNKVGVCQSYAYSLKLLCSLCDIDSEVITGYVDKTLPHAWNVINLDGNWYWIDTTNNYNTSGIPYLMYLTSSTYADFAGYVVDKGYALDDELDFIVNSDESKDWYVAHNLCATDTDELVSKILGNYDVAEGIGCVKIKGTMHIDSSIMQSIASGLLEKGLSEDEIYSISIYNTMGYFVLKK